MWGRERKAKAECGRMRVEGEWAGIAPLLSGQRGVCILGGVELTEDALLPGTDLGRSSDRAKGPAGRPR